MFHVHVTSQGNVDAIRMLGDYAYYGHVSGTPDYHEAARYYQQAAEQPHAQAMFNLG